MLLLTISAMLVWNASASTIEKIEAINNTTVELTASPDVIFSDVSVEGDVKILKDIPVSFSVKDAENLKKVLINLSSDLTANTSYSLISILWANWNIDFSIWDFLQWEISNLHLLANEEWIEKIDILDSRTMELYFTNDLSDDTFEFKILSEIETDWLKSDGNNILQLEVAKALEASTNYIIMVLTLQDVNGNTLTFDEDLQDFTTPADLVAAIPAEETVIAEVYTEPEKVDEWNIEEVALTAAPPETWTATSLLILFAVIANTIFFLRKKFVK